MGVVAPGGGGEVKIEAYDIIMCVPPLELLI